MTPDEMRNLLLDHLYGVLEPDEEQRVQQRLRESEEWRGALEAAREEQALLSEAARLETAGIDLRPPRTDWGRMLRVWATMAAAACAVAAVGWGGRRAYVRDQALDRHPVVALEAPSTLSADRDTEITFAANTVDGDPLPATFKVAVSDTAGRLLYFDDFPAGPDGLAHLSVPHNVGPPGGMLRIRAQADFPDGRAFSTGRLFLREPQRLLARVSTDKPLYRPGEAVRVRAMALSRFKLEPAGALPVKVTVKDPGGSVVAEPFIPTDQGVGSWVYQVPPHAAGGTYTLELSHPDGAFPATQRTFQVRSYRVPTVKWDVELDRDSYAPGASGSADVALERSEGGVPQGAIVTAILTVDGEEAARTEHALPEGGALRVPFTVPGKVDEGRAALTLAVNDGGNVESHLEAVPLTLGRLKVELFPEGGELVAGLPARVYFRVTDPAGEPADLAADVVDDAGRTVVSLEVIERGMGRFTVTPHSGRPLRIVPREPADVRLEGADLPTPSDAGIVLETTADEVPAGAPIRVRLRSTWTGRHQVAAVIRGVRVAEADVELSPGRESTVELPLTEAVGGVARITVFDPAGAPHAERLVAVQPPRCLDVSMSTQHQGYTPGERVRLTVTSRDQDGRPAPAVFGLTVLDDAVVSLADDEDTASLPLHFLLGLEVDKLEEVEVFSQGEGAKRAVDLLLGVQGWRRFGWVDAETFVADHGDAARRLSPLLATQDTPRRLDNEAASRAAVESEVKRASRRYGEGALAIGLIGVVLGLMGTGLAVARRHGHLLATSIALSVLVAVSFVSLRSMPMAVERAMPGLQLADGAELEAKMDWGPVPAAAEAPWAEVPRSQRGVRFEDGDLVAAWGNDPVGPPAGPPADWDAFEEEIGALEELKRLPPFARDNRDFGKAFAGLVLQDGRLAEQSFDILFAKTRATLDTSREALAQLGYIAGFDADGALELNKNVWRISTLSDEPTTRGGMAGVWFGDRPILGHVFRGPAGEVPPDARDPSDPPPPMGWSYALLLMDLEVESARITGGGRSSFVLVREYAHVRKDTGSAARTDFTEVLYWNPYLATNEKGEAVVEFDTSDAVTTFAVEMEAHDRRGALGAGRGTFTNRVPFHVEPKLPQEVSAGDEIWLPVLSSNATRNPLEARIALELKSGLTLLPGTDAALVTNLAADSRGRGLFRIVAGDAVGRAGVAVTGTTTAGHTDQVIRTVQIAPRGYPRSFAAGGMLTDRSQVEIRLPDDLDRTTLTGSVRVLPSALATALDGLEGMLQMPGGCFEQTSSSNYPNIMVLSLLNDRGIADPALSRRAREYLDVGYKRLVGYECKGGGYEWFGSGDGHEALTAYGLLQFHDMGAVYDVDQAMVARTGKWLSGRRDGKGGILPGDHGLHSWVAEPDLRDTYVAWALSEADPALDLTKELDLARTRATEGDDPYVVALAANALANRGDRAVPALLARLATMQQEDGSLTGTRTSVVASTGENLTVETTALAVMAWLRHDDHVVSAQRGLEYLVKSRRNGGSYGSTQATVLALEALLEASRSTAKRSGTVEIAIAVNGETVARRKVSPDDLSAVVVDGDFLGSLRPGVNTLSVTVDGEAKLPWGVEVGYHTRTPLTSPDCRVTVTSALGRDEVAEGESVPLTVTVGNTVDEILPMTLARVGLPAGLEPQVRQLDALRDAGKFDFYELRNREVTLYWRGLAASETRTVGIDLVAAIPGRYEGPATSAYLYYTDDQVAWAAPTRITIRAAE